MFSAQLGEIQYIDDVFAGGDFLTKYVDVNLRANKSRKIMYSRAVVCPVIWVSDEFIRFFPFISTCLIYKAPHFDLGEAHLKTVVSL